MDLKNMFLIESIFIDGLLVFLIIILYSLKRKSENKANTKITLLNLDEAEKAKAFLDKIIRDKFEFYLVTEILPIYKSGMKLDKKQVEDLKEQFFIDVSFLLTKETKKILKNYFNTDAIKIYIIEKFYIYLNKVDITYFNENKINEKDIKSMLS